MTDTNLWLTPLILLPGVALLILSTSTRFIRLHDEVHELVHGEHEASPLVRQHLLARSRLFRNALVSLYLCVATFSLASLLGMVAVLTEMAASAWIVLGIASVGILCLTFAAVLLIRESVLSGEIIDEHRRQFEAGDGTPPLH